MLFLLPREDFFGRCAVDLVEIAVESGERVEAAREREFGNGRVFLALGGGHKVLKPHDIDVIIQIFADILVEKP